MFPDNGDMIKTTDFLTKGYENMINSMGGNNNQDTSILPLGGTSNNYDNPYVYHFGMGSQPTTQTTQPTNINKYPVGSVGADLQGVAAGAQSIGQDVGNFYNQDNEGTTP